MNFTKAKQTMLNKMTGPQSVYRSKLMDQTPQMETISIVDPDNLLDSARKDDQLISSFRMQQDYLLTNTQKYNVQLTQGMGTENCTQMFGNTISTQMKQLDFHIGQDEFKHMLTSSNLGQTGSSSIFIAHEEQKQSSVQKLKAKCPQSLGYQIDEISEVKTCNKETTLISGDYMKKIINQIHEASPFNNNRAQNMAQNNDGILVNDKVAGNRQSEDIMDTIDFEDPKTRNINSKTNKIVPDVRNSKIQTAYKYREQAQAEQTQYLYNTGKQQMQVNMQTDHSTRMSHARVNTQSTAAAYAQHKIPISDVTPKDLGRVAREEIRDLKKPKNAKLVLDPSQFEKEKVFQLVLDSSVGDEELSKISDSDIYGSQVHNSASNNRKFSIYNETSFDSLNTVDHLFVTGSGANENDLSVQIDQENGQNAERRQGKSSKKIDRLKATLRKEANESSQNQQSFQAYSVSGGTQSIRDDSIIEGELRLIYDKLNNFTLEQFHDLRNDIKKGGFNQMLLNVNNQMDNQEQSFAELPSEMTITEDNREVKMDYNFKTFVASKQIHQSQDNQEQQLKKMQQLVYSLERQINICKASNSQTAPLTQVICTGFNSQAPKLCFSREISQCKGLLDQGSEQQEENQMGGPLFLKMLTPDILRSFVSGISPVRWISCGFEHCIAVTQSGRIVSWGYGASGSLGHANYTSYTQPKLISTGALSSKRVVFAESGGYHTGAITEDGQLFMWGRADVGQLGFPLQNLMKDEMGYVLNAPSQVKYFTERKRLVKQIALGEAHTLVLDDLGQVYSFGWSELGQLGIPHLIGKTQSDFQIYKLPLFEKIRVFKISAGSISSSALTLETKQIYVWGSQQNGQLGIGPNDQQSPLQGQPTLLSFLAHEKIINITCGDSHTVALSENGQYYGWGRGYSLESKAEVVSFYPKRLSSIERVQWLPTNSTDPESVFNQRQSTVTAQSKPFNPILSVTDQQRVNMNNSKVESVLSLETFQIEIQNPTKPQIRAQTQIQAELNSNNETKKQKEPCSQKKPTSPRILQIQSHDEIENYLELKKLKHVKQQSAIEKLKVEMDHLPQVQEMDMSQQFKKTKRSRLLEESESFLASLHSTPNDPQFSEHGPRSTTPCQEPLISGFYTEFDAVTTEHYDSQKRLTQAMSSQASTISINQIVKVKAKEIKTSDGLADNLKQKLIKVKNPVMQPVLAQGKVQDLRFNVKKKI